MKQRRYPAAKVGPLLIASIAVLLWWAERKRPLRREVESAAIRHARNLAVAGLAAASVQIAERPIVEPLARHVERERWGLVPWLGGPSWLRTVVALALLDYTLYLWHVLVHRVHPLWRFHAVHHIDRDLDASTALRFHFGELTISIPWRAMQVALIGVSPRQLQLWQQATLVSILFHHSNLRLPPRMERALALLVMTPRLHGIHHSDVARIRDANWSSGLTIWDRLHGTLRYDPPQEAITIGVEGYDGDVLTLRHVLRLPFTAASSR
jgi:sterol desaturase/sphingolipid hydroxylase (fatty acid hydroxylase superfamily)